jgi:recombination protein RecT
MAENVPAKRPKYEESALSAKGAFLQVVNDEKTWTREAIFALQILRGNAEAFSKVDQQSIQNAVTNLALTGATLNPALAQAYLVPRGGKCCLDISYRGLVKIAVDSGSVIDIDSTVVYEKDDFDYEMGLNPKLHHKPSLDPDPGNPVFVYAVAILTSGIRKFIVLNMKEIEKVKSVSRAKSGPWIEFLGEMMRKTAVKKLYKLLPQTDKMCFAVAAANETEGLDLEYKKEVSRKEVADRFRPQTVEAETVDPANEDLLTDEEKEEIVRQEAEQGNIWNEDEK